MLDGVIPTLRVRDARAAQAWFERLGFRETWSHDPGDGFPVFVEVARDRVAFHLSEHGGDGPEGVSVYVMVSDTDALDALHERAVTAQATVIEAPTTQPWGDRVFVLQDLDGNTLRFGAAAQ